MKNKFFTLGYIPKGVYNSAIAYIYEKVNFGGVPPSVRSLAWMQRQF